MDNKKTLDELVAEFEANGEVSNEMLDMIKEDAEMLKLIIAKALGGKKEDVATDGATENTEATTETTTTETTTEESSSTDSAEEKKEDDKKEELSLSAWERAVNKRAESKGYMKGNITDIEATYGEAKQLFNYGRGISLSRIINLFDKEDKIRFMGKISSKEKTIDLTAIKKDEVIAEIAKAL